MILRMKHPRPLTMRLHFLDRAPSVHCAVVVLTLGLTLLSGAGAAQERVYTRATVRQLPTASEQPAVVRMKIMPRGKIPFTTLNFRVDDARLLKDIAVGDEVGFIAEPGAGGNTLKALRKVAPCVRFQPCPSITD